MPYLVISVILYKILGTFRKFGRFDCLTNKQASPAKLIVIKVKFVYNTFSIAT